LALYYQAAKGAKFLARNFGADGVAGGLLAVEMKMRHR